MLGWLLNLGFAAGPTEEVLPDPVPSGNKRKLSLTSANRRISSLRKNRVLSVSNTNRRLK